MKDKQLKYIDDVIEEYLRITDEQIEIPLHIDKAQKKLNALTESQSGPALKKGDVEDAYKTFMQIKKYEDHKSEIAEELKEVEAHLKQFLGALNGKQISYEKKDDVEKLKLTYLFWLEGDQIKSNRK